MLEVSSIIEASWETDSDGNPYGIKQTIYYNRDGKEMDVTPVVLDVGTDDLFFHEVDDVVLKSGSEVEKSVKEIPVANIDVDETLGGESDY